MNSTKLERINLITALISFVLPIFYMFSVFPPMMNTVNSLSGGSAAIISSFGMGLVQYVLSLIQGIRSMVNRKKSTMKLASLCQSFLFGSSFIIGSAVLALQITQYHSFYGTLWGFRRELPVSLIISLIFNVVMLGFSFWKNHMLNALVNPGEASSFVFSIVNLINMVPTVIASVCIAVSTFLDHHQEVKMAIDTVFAVVMFVVILVLLFLFFKKTRVGHGLGALFLFLGATSASSTPSEAPAKASGGISSGERAVLEKKRATITRNLEKLHSGDKTVEFTSNVNEKAANKALAEIDKKLNGSGNR